MSDAVPHPFPAAASSSAGARPAITAPLAPPPLNTAADTAAPDGALEVPPESPGKLVYRRRMDFLDHMLRSLDIVIYTHISYLYLLDCSMLRLLISSFAQLWALTPKPLVPPSARRTHRPILFTLLATTAFAVIHHLLSPAPDSSEEVHHYLHGGLLIDFIGQRGPTSKTRLVLLDLFILLLQLFQLSVTITKIDTPPYATILENSGAGTEQDVDSEERGMRPRPIYHPDGSLRERVDIEERDERDALLSPSFATTPEAEEERQALEVKRRSYQITSGEFEVTTIDVVGMVMRVWGDGRRLGDAVVGAGVPRDVEAGANDGERLAEMARRGRAWRFAFPVGSGGRRVVSGRMNS